MRDRRGERVARLAAALAVWLMTVLLGTSSRPLVAGEPAAGDSARSASSISEDAAKPAAVAATPSEAPTTSAPAPRSDQQVIASIDQFLRQGWETAGVAPSSAASDGAWCRRVYLDLVGRIPKAEETAAFLADKSSDKRARLIERLLDSDQYLDEYATHWALVWTNWLIGRTAGTEPRSLVDRAGMEQYLRRTMAAGKPYDQLVVELVSAEGCNRPGSEDFNGAVNFLIGSLGDKAVQATAKTARLFLGMQVQCTQCHNHPFNSAWQQSQFWGLNAFFRQAAALKTTEGRDLVEARLGDQDFAGEGGNPQQAEIYYELKNGQLEAVFPTFVDGRRIEPIGYVSDKNWRDELAQLIVTSEYFAPAIVNRLWGQLFGYGFTRPVDDIGPRNLPTHPELLAQLAADLAAHRYDLKRLIGWLVSSEAYGLSAATTSRNQADEPALGEKPLFSHFYLRQMSAEQLYESLLAVTQADQSAATTAEERDRRRGEWLRQFSVAFGNDEGGEATTFDGTIPQALMMMNGELVREATSGKPGSFLARLAESDQSDKQKIDTLYLAALSRAPSKKEASLAQSLWQARGGDTLAALEDVWWALLNSNEFLFNH